MITTVLEFFALGTFGFWLLCGLISIIFVACLEHDNTWFPSVLSVALVALYWKALVLLAIGWQAIAIGVLVYAVSGIVWSMFRWFRYVKSTADTYREEHGGKLTEQNRSTLVYKLKASNNKSRITAWIAYWPWSLVWNITGDFFKMAYESLQGVYQSIADRAIGKFTTVDESK